MDVLPLHVLPLSRHRFLSATRALRGISVNAIFVPAVTNRVS